jgi:hypothetical protein
MKRVSSGQVQVGALFGLSEIFSLHQNFIAALIAALIGYLLVEFLRKRLQ